MQGPASNSASNQVVHILVGHSVVVQTEARLKRVLVANPAVVTTNTTAPNELVITAAMPGSSSIVIWHEDGQSRIIDVFADVDVAMLRESIERSFPKENIQVQAEEGRVVLTGIASTQAVADTIVKMAAPFAKDVVNSIAVAEPGRQKQVLLKVRFAEVDRGKLSSFGFNLLSTGAGNTPGVISTQQFGSVSAGGRLTGVIGAGNRGASTDLTLSDLLNIFIFRPDLNLGATIRDLQTKNVLQILAEPNLMAASGEPAKFLAGGELPYPIVQPGGQGGASSISITFRPFGVRLDFTGTVQNDNTIRLKVAPEVSSLDYSNAVTISGFTLPAISTRRAETVVDLKDGQSFGIAGLLDQRTTQLLSKVPGIGDVPILGLLFKSKSLNKTATELVVLVTPTIVDPLAANAPLPEMPKQPIAPLNPTEFDKKQPPLGGK